MDLDPLLSSATRLVLAVRAAPSEAPLARSSPFWWDGVHVWLAVAADAAEVERLDADPDCALLVPAAVPDGDHAVVRGRARVYRPTDVRALVLHGGVVAAAMTALAVKEAPAVAGRLREAVRHPSDWRPPTPAAVRIEVRSAAGLGPPSPPPGIVPALPTEVAPPVRRRLAGRRDGVLAADVDGVLALLPVTWGPGFTLAAPEGAVLPASAPATLVLEDGDGADGHVALSLAGRVADGRFTALRARWSTPSGAGAATITPRAGITLPD